MSNIRKNSIFTEAVTSVLNASLEGSRSLDVSDQTLLDLSRHVQPTDMLRSGATRLIFAPVVHRVSRLYGAVQPAQVVRPTDTVPYAETGGWALYVLSPEDASRFHLRSPTLPTLVVDVENVLDGRAT